MNNHELLNDNFFYLKKIRGSLVVISVEINKFVAH